MQFIIDIPTKEEILASGVEVNVAPEGGAWSRLCLGEFANRSGVYIHHSDSQILYVGKATSGKWGNFGERFRREFQGPASGHSSLYKCLVSQRSTINAFLMDLDEIDRRIQSSDAVITKERKALVMEQFLIGVFSPLANKA